MTSWEGLGCCLGAAALYLLGLGCDKDAEELKSVTRVGQLRGLAQLLEYERALPLVVAISGRVSSDTPIKCECSGLCGVIVEETAKQYFLKQDEAGKWIRDSELMHSMSKSVPWFLDDGTGRAFVVGARNAMDFELPVLSEALEEPGRSHMRGTLDCHQGLKMLGVKRIERGLPTGTSLTVVGEAVKNDIGTITIQRPRNGPFYVSSKTVDQLISNLGGWARFYKYAAGGLSIFGLYLVSKHAILCLMEIWSRRRCKLRKRVLAAAAKRSSQDNEGENDKSHKTNNGSDGTKRDRSTPDLCIICLQRDYNAVFVPCGHMCCCVACCLQLTNCPLCRGRIGQVVRTFRH